MSRVIIVLIALMFIFLLGCQSDSDQISKLRDGPSSNKLREKLRAPIIDSYMVKTEIHSFGSDRWESKEEIPTDGIALHAFKNILPYNKSDFSLEEWDGIRMKINDSVGNQINITSEIKRRFVVNRTGELFIYRLNEPNNDRLATSRKLTEKEIDSIFISWKLNHLVLNN